MLYSSIFRVLSCRRGPSSIAAGPLLSCCIASSKRKQASKHTTRCRCRTGSAAHICRPSVQPHHSSSTLADVHDLDRRWRHRRTVRPTTCSFTSAEPCNSRDCKQMHWPAGVACGPCGDPRRQGAGPLGACLWARLLLLRRTGAQLLLRRIESALHASTVLSSSVRHHMPTSDQSSNANPAPISVAQREQGQEAEIISVHAMLPLPLTIALRDVSVGDRRMETWPVSCLQACDPAIPRRAGCRRM
jgi:hypothetical protein